MGNLRKITRSIGLMIALCVLSSPSDAERLHSFRRILLTEEFQSEGANFGDINGDGLNDVVAGPYWYAGPEFRKRYAFAPAIRSKIKSYSNYFFCFTDDFNGDGYTDILTVGMPGEPAYWHENPRTTDHHWPKHKVMDAVGNESPTYVDVTGDGRRELVCIVDGSFGFAEIDPSDPTATWKFTPVTDNQGYGRFTHGLGIGDIDGDGRFDLLEANGWWKRGSDDSRYTLQRYKFAQSAAQMFAYDFDGDGDNDVLATLDAHGYGLNWFEQVRTGGKTGFRPHAIMTADPSDNPWGLAISQMHAVALTDIDGDGVKDIVTGKRYWAHGGNDPGSKELQVLYWFRTVRTDGGVEFHPHLIDSRSGVGTQLTVGDLNGDGLNDLVVGNKLGTFVFIHEVRDVDVEAYAAAAAKKQSTPRHVVGTSLFNENVRTTEPLSPEEQARTFTLPPGFEIELVTSELDIAKPMNLAFDGRGRLWVSSSEEYPFAATNDQPGRDKIVVLEDTDNDGRFDRTTTFSEGLNIPMGLYPYRNGVVCFSIPDILYLQDTDDDGRADKRQRLYGPFDTTRDTHGMCNGFVRGLDGWLYACHGFNNQTSVAGTDGHRVTMHSGNTFRMRLDGSRIEHFTHGQVNPFGMTVDRNGDFFTADCHTKPINLLIPGGYHESFGRAHNGLGFIPNVMEHLHQSTGIGGIALGADTNFPDVYQASSFGGNVVTSRINRNTLRHVGSSVVADEEPDFCVSSDPWFRPVDLQVGPDGALYVADFYNRIIGHYEVDLNHPGRDRWRGRIWKISYRGEADRRDSTKPRDDADTMPIRRGRESLIAELASSNEVRGRLALDELCDSDDMNRVAEIRAAMEGATDVQFAKLLWALHRSGALDEEQLGSATKHSSALVRIHALKIIGQSSWNSSLHVNPQLIISAIQDGDPLVVRAAAGAVRAQPSFDFVKPLMQAYDACSPQDGHLKYALKLALAEHFKEESWFSEVVSRRDLSGTQSQLLADLSLFLSNGAAATYLANYVLDHPGISPERRKAYFRVAARGVDRRRVNELILRMRSQFRKDTSQQLELLNVVRTEFPGEKPPEELMTWAADLADEYLLPRPGESETAMPWQFIPADGAQGGSSSFAMSDHRQSSDRKKPTVLWSSFPRGETAIGTYRSTAFTLKDSFSFYLCGHDGYPDKPLQHKNFAVLRDATTHRELMRAAAPRNDTAQPIRWDTSGYAGQIAYFELVDGDKAGAYAWIAAGRFSQPQLNPSRFAQRRAVGCKLVSDYGLDQFRGRLAQSLRRSQSADVARAIAGLDDLTTKRVLASALAVNGVDAQLRSDIVEAILDAEEDVTKELARVFRVVDGHSQKSLANPLAKDAKAAPLLLDLIDDGLASTVLLRDNEIVAGMRLTLNQAERQRLEKLLEKLPDDAAQVDKLIQSRITAFRAHDAVVDAGRVVFEKSCINCHQLAGKGQRVGPNLDGIGNRGLVRMVEDILAPNRNVDHAFRATNLLTKDGLVISGLMQDSEVPQQLRLVTSQGEAKSIPKREVEEISRTRTSPMPANFGTAIDEREFLNLIAFLLNQK